jgi:hypothetical protein
MRADQKMKSVYFYGLFMDEDLLKEKGLNPSAAKIAYVTGYGLRIGERATLMQSSQERSYGSVIQLDEEEIEILYGDKSVEDYIPEEVTAIGTNGSSLAAMSYILPISKLSGQNREYAKSLAVVARKIGLPEEYIDEIEKWIK